MKNIILIISALLFCSISYSQVETGFKTEVDSMGYNHKITVPTHPNGGGTRATVTTTGLTPNMVPRCTTATPNIQDSQIYDDGTNVGINKTNPATLLWWCRNFTTIDN